MLSRVLRMRKVYLCQLSYTNHKSFFLGPDHAVPLHGKVENVHYAFHTTRESIDAALAKYPYIIEQVEFFTLEVSDE